VSNERIISSGQVDIPSWVESYIGLPFKEHGRDRDGVDCWGLVRLVLAEQFNIDLPAYVAGYASTEDAADIARLIRGEMGPWVEVSQSNTRPGDAALMRLQAQPCHVSVIVAPGWMLHVEDGVDSCLDRYDGARWSRRVVGIFRYQGD
jgi:cell wall-associated NlpC family hydrolase